MTLRPPNVRTYVRDDDLRGRRTIFCLLASELWLASFSDCTWCARPMLCRNALRDESRDCEFFTMMRHPIDRAVSMFFYCHHGRPDKVIISLGLQLHDLAEPHVVFTAPPRVCTISMTRWYCFASCPVTHVNFIPVSLGVPRVKRRRDVLLNATCALSHLCRNEFCNE